MRIIAGEQKYENCSSRKLIVKQKQFLKKENKYVTKINLKFLY